MEFWCLGLGAPWIFGRRKTLSPLHSAFAPGDAGRRWPVDRVFLGKVPEMGRWISVMTNPIVADPLHVSDEVKGFSWRVGRNPASFPDFGRPWSQRSNSTDPPIPPLISSGYGKHDLQGRRGPFGPIHWPLVSTRSREGCRDPSSEVGPS
ncbi:hypothetical protein GWK47_026034 [Chionoecetes opilio]|uniref:Uncharacterized protein n=1 Tax=Chionoecetes opilio TaxID=41210 RepID=A0A8J8WMZ0_CHIOP|nr:hypothetical protein GWK47_026034 [Chionoecetes opilio]